MQPLATPATIADSGQPQPSFNPPVGQALPAMQEILNKLPQVTNILVTVKANPSVDELAAALGLTIALNNIGKHATAVFSGKIPDAMSFLKPDKTFESDVHSLRDFIISLNKEKADKLRFAQEGEIVKIFITPKANLSSQDLTYNAGDFNVEMVLAIGIANQNELDSVIAAHGKILHEATVATLTAGATPSTIGSINWAEPNLSSASAMVLQLLQAINPPVTISADIATALLTGLVADTNMFSNQNTTPQVMESAAKLMSAGANHQLVASSIGIQPGNITTTTPATTAASTLEVADDQPTPAESPETQEQTPPEPSPTAPNTTPMAQEEPEAVTPQPITDPTSTSQGLIQEEPSQPKEIPPEPLSLTPAPAPEPTLSPSLSDALPKPVDITQPIVPADILPPAAPILASPTPAEPNQAPLGQQPAANTAPELTPQNQPEQIRSEIDQIYGSSQDADTSLPSTLLSNNFGNPSQSPDTSVQVEQANSTTTQAARTEASQPQATAGIIPATKTEDASSSDLLGIDNLPKLEIPSQLPPPPPPPVAGSSTFQPTIDFSQINQS